MTIDGKIIGLPDLAELPQWDVRMETRWTTEGVFRGIRLVDLLARYGENASYKRLTLTANNGYKIALSPKTQEGMDTALVAYSLDGQLLDTRNKGPFWLLWPNEVDKLMTGEALGDVWIWGLIEIREVPWN
ncbi:hypothetical protein [Rhodospirillum sp. A1_3_36]|uniref:hypothetical protein n=1 Tax=Rhodospirillum sp. A1_3_36 TaxID=3391666 RepID=UPI0039A633FC